MKKILLSSLLMLILFWGCMSTGNVVKQDSNNEETFQSIASYLQLGDPQKAISEYEKAYAEKPDDIDTRVLYIRLLILAEKYEEARTEINAILAVEPDNKDALYALSLVEGMTGNVQREKKILEELENNEQSSTEAKSSLARIYLDEKEYTKAKGLLEQVEKKENDNIVVLLGLGNIFFREKEYKKAEEYLDKAIQLDTEYPFSYIDRAKIKRRQGDYTGALADLDKASKLEPDYPYIYYDRGRIYMDRKERTEAIREFSIAIDKDPKLFIAYVMRAGLYDENDEYKKAIADYEKVIELKPQYYYAYSALGCLYLLTENYEPAAKLFGNAYNYDKTRYELVLLGALALKWAGKEEEAVSFIKERQGQLPRDTWYYQMSVYYMNPQKDYNIVTIANAEKNEVTKGRILFYIGAQYLLQKMEKAAVIYLMETKHIDRPGIIEKRLAEKILDKPKN